MFCSFVCFKWFTKKNSLTTPLGMVIYITTLPGSTASWHKATFYKPSFRKFHFKDHACLWQSFLDCTEFALAFFELWERTNWHPVSNSQRPANQKHRLSPSLTDCLGDGRSSIKSVVEANNITPINNAQVWRGQIHIKSPQCSQYSLKTKFIRQLCLYNEVIVNQLIN